MPANKMGGSMAALMYKNGEERERAIAEGKGCELKNRFS
jgi:hypothetical protein